MIKQVRSSLKTFHTANFGAGMNVVLADTAEDSNETESTNGLGKTTLIRIIHFCLGSTRDKVLNHPDLAGQTFGMTFIHDGHDIEVERGTNEDTVSVSRAFIGDFQVGIIAAKGDRAVISLDDWTLLLSARFLPDARSGGARQYAPSFREVSLYLARLGKAAFTKPDLAFQGQPAASKKLAVSYLLGLNWNHQRQLEEEIGKRVQINAAVKALEEANASVDDQTIGNLDAERVVLEDQIKQKREEVSNFNVREDYRSLENQLNEVDRSIHDLVNENHSDARLLEYYQRSVKGIPAASPNEPISILKEAGAVFKEEALRTLQEVADFHAQIYRNRSEFLKTEISQLKAQIAVRDAEIDRLAQEKSNLLRLLKSSGALENLIELQRGLSDLEARHVALRARIDEHKKYDRRKDELSTSILKSRGLLKRDLEDRRQTVDDAVSLFGEYTKFLYGVSGRLVVDVKDSGYSFAFSIDREGSDGVDQMVVFCFDLAVATLRARRRAQFKTLIHDSSLFADVDPRQYGHALQLAATVSRREDFQYICCLNAGALPAEHMGGLKLDDHIKLRLDDSDTGRLLGVRLPPREHA